MEETRDPRNSEDVSEGLAGLLGGSIPRGPLEALSSSVGDVHSQSLRRALSSVRDASGSFVPGPRNSWFRFEESVPFDVSSPELGTGRNLFGGGLVYGGTDGNHALWGGGPAGVPLHWVDLPRGTVSCGPLMLTYPLPTAPALLEGRDWFRSPDGARAGFAEDPSRHGILWATCCMVDHGDVLESFPYVPGIHADHPSESSNFAMAAMQLAVSGPTRMSVEAFVSAAAGLPLCPEDGEVGDFSVVPGKSTVVPVGSSGVVLRPGDRPLEWVVPGARGLRGRAVSASVRVLDPVSDSGWWRSFGAVSVPSPWPPSRHLVFLGGPPSSDWPPAPVADEASVEKFLSSMDWGPQPEWRSSPAEFAAEVLLGASVVPVLVDASRVRSVSRMCARLSVLGRLLPPSCVLHMVLRSESHERPCLPPGDSQARLAGEGRSAASGSAPAPSERAFGPLVSSAHHRIR